MSKKKTGKSKSEARQRNDKQLSGKMKQRAGLIANSVLKFAGLLERNGSENLPHEVVDSLRRQISHSCNELTIDGYDEAKELPKVKRFRGCIGGLVEVKVKDENKIYVSEPIKRELSLSEIIYHSTLVAILKIIVNPKKQFGGKDIIDIRNKAATLQIIAGGKAIHENQIEPKTDAHNSGGAVEKKKSKPKNIKERFTFSPGQVCFDENDIKLPTGLTIEVFEKLYNSWGVTIRYCDLDLNSENDVASEQLRTAKMNIQKSLEEHKTNCEIKTKARNGYFIREITHKK